MIISIVLGIIVLGLAIAVYMLYTNQATKEKCLALDFDLMEEDKCETKKPKV